MNIKNLIKSQKARHRLMRLGKFLPDSIMISLQYRILLGRWPNLKNPKRFSEWIQIYKKDYRNSLIPKCVDKYEVREYLISKGCQKLLNNLYQVCAKAEEIDFESLPKKFVIKTTNGGNGDNILIVRDKNKLNKEKAIQVINSWLHKNYSTASREWAYCEASIHPRIIVEEYLENSHNSHELDDYKFLCFNGKFQYLWVDKDRYSNHKRGFWNNQFEFIKNIESDHPTFENPPTLPTNIKQMKEVAETLASDFPFVRVDLYNVNGNIIFGELTFYPWSGYIQFNDDSFDYKLGSYFKKFHIT